MIVPFRFAPRAAACLVFRRIAARNASVKHFQEKHVPDTDPAWEPVFRPKMRPIAGAPSW
jgi:hypothetical protein